MRITQPGDGFKMNTIIRFGIHKQTLSGHKHYVSVSTKSNYLFIIPIP